MIEHRRLLELLDYNPSTGVFTRKVALSNNTKVGDVAGNLIKGYVELSVDAKTYLGHVLAWFYVHGQWPKARLDHKDRNRSNNAIGNLRECTQSENGANTAMKRSNSTGFKGVTKHGSKYKAAVMVRGKRLHLGVFASPEEAAEAHDAAAVKHFGEFAVTNKSLNIC